MKLRTEATFRDEFSKLTTGGLVLVESISPPEMSVFHAFSFAHHAVQFIPPHFVTSDTWFVGATCPFRWDSICSVSEIGGFF
jgi:hypothetical protein